MTRNLVGRSGLHGKNRGPEQERIGDTLVFGVGELLVGWLMFI